jgi:hypothetical protein
LDCGKDKNREAKDEIEGSDETVDACKKRSGELMYKDTLR